MAGVRLYGYQQTTKSAVSLNGPESQAASPMEPHSDEIRDEKSRDEYKLIYHQVYRTTICTFRNHIQDDELYLHKVSSIQETVDKLLAIICTDPLNTG